MRCSLLLLLALGVATAPAAADAALKKYRVRTINITESPDTSPPVQKIGADDDPEPPHDAAFVDDSTPGSPVLKKFRFKFHLTTTVLVPGISATGANIFISANTVEGPGPLRKPASFTGTGHTAAGSTLRWGIVTGWTVTGATYCRSSPPVICELAGNQDGTTVDPTGNSDFYDMGTWTFHATGFTATPFVHQYFTPPGNFGNNQRWIRGVRIVDFSVPALPAIGLALIGGSLATGAVAMLRRRRRRGRTGAGDGDGCAGRDT